MQTYTELTEAINYDRKHPQGKHEIYAKGTQEYSTFRYIKTHSEFLLPSSIQDAISKGRPSGIIASLNTVWVGTEKLILWNYVANTITEIDFSAPVTHFLLFKPKENYFSSRIVDCVFIVTREQILVYGISSDETEFVNTGLVTAAPEDITCIAQYNTEIYIGTRNGILYKVLFKNETIWSGRSIYLRNIDRPLLPVFNLFRKVQPILNVSAGKHWVISIVEKCIKLYSIKGTRLFLEKEMEAPSIYLSSQIVDESEGNIFFYCVTRSGSRDFYSNKFLFNRKGPFAENEIADIKNCTTSPDSVLILRSAFTTGMLTLISFNQDQIYNPSANKAVENYEIFNLDNPIKLYLDGKNIHVMTDSFVKILSASTPEEFLQRCRPEETYTFNKNYGERETTYYYYMMKSNNMDTSKIEHLYSKSTHIHLQAFYTFISRLIANILHKKIDSDFFNDAEKIVRRIITVNTKCNMKSKFVTDLNESINFMKICFEYGITNLNSLFSILTDEKNIKKTLLDKLLNQFSGKIDLIINVLLSKAPSFIPFNDIYYQRGMECLQKIKTRENLNESLSHFKNLTMNTRPIIEKYNSLKFYSGSVVLISKLHDTFEAIVKLLRESIHCRRSMEIALEDYRKEFHFAIFESILSNLNEFYMIGECACCGENSVPFAKSDFLSLVSPYFELFLQEKLETSFKEDEFTLLWKYYALRANKEFGKQSEKYKEKTMQALLKVAENKPLVLEKRMEYLNIAASLNPSKEIKIRLEVAKIQSQFLNKNYVPILRNQLLNANDLFNDYLLPYNDAGLALKLTDIFEYCNPTLLNQLWSNGLKDTLINDMNFIKSLNLKGCALNLEIIGNILIQKCDASEPNLVNFLEEIGFQRNEIILFFEKVIYGTKISHPSQKKKILDVLVLSKEGQMDAVKRIVKECSYRYGI